MEMASWIFNFLWIFSIFNNLSNAIPEHQFEFSGGLVSHNIHIHIHNTSSSFNTPRLIKSDVIEYSEASYISIHFSKFYLPVGDYVRIRSPTSLEEYTYHHLGRASLGLHPNGFFATHIIGSKAIIEYYSTRHSPIVSSSNSISSFESKYGYSIDKYVHGYNKKNEKRRETICGRDDSIPVKCLQRDLNFQMAYKKSKAVARLLIDGRVPCTGWLVGNEGHLITNYHCIRSTYIAQNTDYEFGAESSSCEEECKEKWGCKGDVMINGGEMIASDYSLDYALIKLNISSVSSHTMKFGYYQFRNEKPKLNEPIYIPNHPNGYAKRVARTNEKEKQATIEKVDFDGCDPNQIGYMADTEHGSSGAPVVSLIDNQVLALHNCGGCHNTGHSSIRIINSLREQDALPNNAIDQEASSTTTLPTTKIPTVKKDIQCSFSFKKRRCMPREHCEFHWFRCRQRESH